MIVDAHVHLGCLPSLNLSIDADGAIRMADAVGVDKIFCTHLASLSYDTFTGDELTLLAMRRFPGRILGYVTVSSPRHGTKMVEHVERYLGEYGFHGVKIYSHPKGVGSPEPWLSITDPYMYPILEKASDLQVPVLAHATPKECEAVCSLFPNVLLIMAHMGGTQIANGDWHAAIAVARTHPNLYLDATSSCVDFGMIEEAVRAVGPERVIWGSDMPLLDPRCQIQKIREAEIGEDSKRLVLGGNVERLLSRRRC